jgi:hypothetical protein
LRESIRGHEKGGGEKLAKKEERKRTRDWSEEASWE